MNNGIVEYVPRMSLNSFCYRQVIRGFYNLNNPTQRKLALLRRTLLGALCQKRFAKAMQVCEHAMRILEKAEASDDQWYAIHGALSVLL